ncbi:DNA primase [Flagellimonas sp.]|uniref:DNA primase n=1 Tax=Flagellimonas sp. TaxID=2058762 RepID=UPI003BAA129E
MKYSETSIERIRESDIVKTIGNFVNLKREGSNYKCCSPFTNEKTPSFVVSPAKQMFKCFSSGVGGDGISFVMKHKGLGFVEAIEVIAGIHNIYLEKEEVTPEQQRVLDEKSEMYALLDTVATKFLATRKKLPENHWAQKMIAARQFGEEVLISFMVGYAPTENEVTKWVAEKGQLGVAKELGLSDTKNSHSYDKFKNRLMFPIHNHKGAVVGFGGRRSNNDEDQQFAKYLNSKESLVYNKSRVLYGLFQAKKEISKSGTAILTEGYTDVLAMHENGCTNAVASCGTALTDAHASLLAKYAQEVVLLRDGDEAGHKATIKDIDICLAQGLQVSVCVLPDGEDPDSFSREYDEEISDWISNNKKDAIYWKVEQYDMVRDRYEADILAIKEATLEDIRAVQAEMHSEESLSELQGDQLKAAKKSNADYRAEIAQFKKDEKEFLKGITKIDPHKKEVAFTNICQTLYHIKNEVKRDVYLKQVSKLMNIPVARFKSQIGELEVAETKKIEEKKGVRPTNIKLPDGGDMDEYMEYGFVTVDNTFWFQRGNGDFFQGTDFKLVPLFHILGDKENKRLCELINTAGQKIMIDFDSDMLASFNEFRRYLFHYSGFAFYTHNGMRSEHFDRFVIRFNRAFEPALELITMGWNTKGFFAFADGVYWNGKFRGVNKYGIIHLPGIDKEKKEYNQNVDYYYSPAFSVMHKDNQDGDDKYENDRFFVYRQSPVTLMDWMVQMREVFKEKGIVGCLFVFGSIFRDLFLTHYDSFPLLGGFGEKDSGKSAFGKIIQNFFYYRLPALDLTQATHVGFSRRLSRNVNTVQFLDEYQDKQCDEKIFSGMMGAWNGIGREKGMNTGDKRTLYDRINSAIYYCGQFMPTRMENALATRTVSLMFQNQNYSSEQKNEFSKLLNWTNEGISSLIVDLVEHRSYFEQHLPQYHAESVRILKEEMSGKDYQERIFTNTSMLFTTFRLLKDKLEFPFNEKEVKKLCIKLIVDNSEQIADSNGLTVFWDVIQFLYENTGQVKEGQDFKIESPLEVKIMGEKRQQESIQNEQRHQILYLRLKSVYQWYNKEVTKREGVDVIGETTIRQYFKSRGYFIGLVKGTRFGTAGTQSCYAFDYDMMKELNLISLEKDNTADTSGSTISENTVPAGGDNEDDDLPF